MPQSLLPPDIDDVLETAWRATTDVPGFLSEGEAKFIGLLVACIPARGAIVEIGSFKGRSTVMLAKVAAHYGLGPVVAIDPHTHNLTDGIDPSSRPSTFEEFQTTLRHAGVAEHVEIHQAYSADVSRNWNREIRFLWIDGDHTYKGAKTDFDGFAPWLVPGGVVALHDVLETFSGPIRVYIEEVLRSTRFGPCGFVNSIAWAQSRPIDAERFGPWKRDLELLAAPLLPLVLRNVPLHGFQRRRYNLIRSRIPSASPTPVALADLLDSVP